MTRTGGRRVLGTIGAAGLLWALAAGSAFAGNNGTIKIHEVGTPERTPNNDPKVCAFDVEGFGFDDHQLGHIKFTVQGGDAPTGTDTDGLDVEADGHGYFLSGPYHLPEGHYKATLYGKGGNDDVKAKSKVFKVSCDGGGGGNGEDGGGGSEGPTT